MKRLFQAFLLLFLSNCLFVSIYSQTKPDNQTIDIPKLIQEAKNLSIKARDQLAGNYSNNFKKTVEIKGKKNRITSETFESSCLSNGCDKILVEKNGIRLSEKKISKSRDKIAQNILKGNNVATSPEMSDRGIRFQINTVYVEPNIFLDICETSFNDYSTYEGRQSIKLEFKNCRIDKESPKFRNVIGFMSKIQGFIWIDNEDKSVTKLIAFTSDESKTNKVSDPLLELSFTRVPEGLWFWKMIKIQGYENTNVFTGFRGNWQLDFYDYQRFKSDAGLKIKESN